MKRRTRRWSQVQGEAKRLASIGCTPKEIAEQLDVDKSTVTRWIAKKKLTLSSNVVDMPPASTMKKPAEWAKAIRDEYALDETDDQLVTMAEAAAAIANDSSAKRSERLNAMRTFRGIVGQLRLVARSAAASATEEQQQPVAVKATPAPPPKAKNPPVRRRSTVDPRTHLRAVK